MALNRRCGRMKPHRGGYPTPFRNNAEAEGLDRRSTAPEPRRAMIPRYHIQCNGGTFQNQTPLLPLPLSGYSGLAQRETEEDKDVESVYKEIAPIFCDSIASDIGFRCTLAIHFTQYLHCDSKCRRGFYGFTFSSDTISAKSLLMTPYSSSVFSTNSSISSQALSS